MPGPPPGSPGALRLGIPLSRRACRTRGPRYPETASEALASAASPRVDQMLIIAGSLFLDPDHRSDFLDANAAVVGQAREAAGCLDFVQAADPLDPTRINIFERWDTRRTPPRVSRCRTAWIRLAAHSICGGQEVCDFLGRGPLTVAFGDLLGCAMGRAGVITGPPPGERRHRLGQVQRLLRRSWTLRVDSLAPGQHLHKLLDASRSGLDLLGASNSIEDRVPVRTCERAKGRACTRIGSQRVCQVLWNCHAGLSGVGGTPSTIGFCLANLVFP